MPSESTSVRTAAVAQSVELVAITIAVALMSAQRTRRSRRAVADGKRRVLRHKGRHHSSIESHPRHRTAARPIKLISSPVAFNESAATVNGARTVANAANVKFANAFIFYVADAIGIVV